MRPCANKIVVVGGGLGGLSSAIYLASKGWPITLYEQNKTLGGKMNQCQLQGFRFDTGPSLMTMPFVLDDLFAAAGARREDYLQMIPLQTICRYFFTDGTIFDAYSDPEQMMAAIAQLSPADVAGFQQFMAYSKKIYEMTAPIFLFTPIHEWRKICNRRNLRVLFSLPAIDPFRTVHQAVSRFFQDQRLIQLFDRYATYNGSNPFQAPATLNIISYVELGLGGFYFAGGMYRLVSALEELALKLGVSIERGVRVEKIIHHNGKMAGVLVNGEKIAATQVVCNADVVTAHLHLLDVDASVQRRMSRLEPSLSGVIFLWGMKKKHPQLRHHNIFFSNDYPKEFKEIFVKRSMPTQPTVYIAITSQVDTADAPANGENWFVLINAPYLTSGQDWAEMVQKTRQAVLAMLKQHGLDVADEQVCEKIITPVDFFERYGSNAGSIYGISSNSRSTAFRRPPNRSRKIKGLYFAGGSTHPGGGVPLTLLSGKMAAELLLESLRHD